MQRFLNIDYSKWFEEGCIEVSLILWAMIIILNITMNLIEFAIGLIFRLGDNKVIEQPIVGEVCHV